MLQFLKIIQPRPTRIFKTRPFQKWAKQVQLDDFTLKLAVQELENGLYDANLGGNLYKKRVAINNRGKSGGLRTIIAFKKKDKAFFIYGFAKNKEANISDIERLIYKKLAKMLLGFNDARIEQAIKIKELIEVQNEKKFTQSSA